jgi:hypothetical protein
MVMNPLSWIARTSNLASIPENYLPVTVAFPSPSAEEVSWLKPDNTFMQTAQSVPHRCAEHDMILITFAREL